MDPLSLCLRLAITTLAILQLSPSTLATPSLPLRGSAAAHPPTPPSTLSSRQDAPVEVVRGVSLGGWLVTESWITPSLYESTGAPDEWNLCNSLEKNCQKRLNSHYESFYTLDDFNSIKAAGLSHVRIPIGYWSIIPLLDFEPYVAGAYPYLIRAVNWAGQVGLKVLIDLHGAPGSQNGNDHSGLSDGQVLWQTNSSNIERTVAALQNLSAEFSQPIYNGVVDSIQLLNEPQVTSTGATTGLNMTTLKDFYSQSSEAVRSASENSILVVIHDGFWGPSYWRDYDPLSSASSTSTTSPDWLVVDTHQYYAFEQLADLPHNTILTKICNMSTILKFPSSGIPATIVGEWSLETGVAPNTRTVRSRQASQETRTWLRLLFEAQLAAYSPSTAGQSSAGWYFWCWKTEYPSNTWSYKTGLSLGTIPQDVSNASQLVFPRLDNGCIDSSFDWQAPERVNGGLALGIPSFAYGLTGLVALLALL